MSPTTAASCRICYGTKKWGGDNRDQYDCTSCAEPSIEAVTRALALLEPKHMAFLRAYHHTLANQPITGEQWDAMELRVDDDDAVISDDFETVLIPATSYWLGGAQASLGHGEITCWVHYTPLGLALRHCIMAGADAAVR